MKEQLRNFKSDEKDTQRANEDNYNGREYRTFENAQGNSHRVLCQNRETPVCCVFLENFMTNILNLHLGLCVVI